MFVSQVDADRRVREARMLLQRMLPGWASDTLVLRRTTGGVPRWEQAARPAVLKASNASPDARALQPEPPTRRAA